jgi:hypothetical protein
MTKEAMCSARRAVRGRRIAIGAGAMLFALAGWGGAAFAHGDEPHGDAPHGGRSITVAPRAEARIGAQEAVIAYLDGKVVVFLQRYIDGVPTAGAEIELTIDFIPESLEEVAPGVYSSGDWPLAAGRNDVELAYTLGEEKGSAALVLAMPEGAAATAQPEPSLAAWGIPGFIMIVFAVLIFAAVNGLLAQRARRA